MPRLKTLLFSLLICTVAFAQGSLPLPKGGTTIYVVRPGDSLWRISKRFFGNPLLWPRLWEANPYIDNPHLIYPGDSITLSGLPVVKFDPKIRDRELMNIEPPPPVFYYSQGGSEGLMPHNEWENMGSILSSNPPKILLGEGDIVYTNVGTNHGVSKGDKFTVFRTSKKVMHPITGKRVGYKVAVLGEIEIIDILGKRQSAAKITDSFREITRGAKIRPREAFVKEVVMKNGKKMTQGFIVSSKNDLQLIGQGAVVYIDIGKEDDLLPGHTLSVFAYPKKAYDPDNKELVTIPGARKGKLVLLNVREQASTGIIVESARQLEPGDMVVLDM